MTSGRVGATGGLVGTRFHPVTDMVILLSLG